jgi:hypothetical protein
MLTSNLQVYILLVVSFFRSFPSKTMYSFLSYALHLILLDYIISIGPGRNTDLIILHSYRKCTFCKQFTSYLSSALTRHFHPQKGLRSFCKLKTINYKTLGTKISDNLANHQCYAYRLLCSLISSPS